MQLLKLVTVEEEVLDVFDCSTLTVTSVDDICFEKRCLLCFKEEHFSRMRVWCIWPSLLLA